MNTFAAFTVSVLCFTTAYSQTGKTKSITAIHQPASSFQSYRYRELPVGAVKPGGWLRHQLQQMRDGTTGHLDEVYAKIKNDNGWLGGKGDGWEETPYWLDGAVPLAYLLDDQSLKEKVLLYINRTLDHQRPSGYFGPVTKWEREFQQPVTTENSDKGEDWWPKMVMLKVLQQYYMATADKRVIPFMTKYFHYQLNVLGKSPIGKWSEWATSRGADNILVAQWLYSITKDTSLLQLCGVLQQQSFPWSQYFSSRDWVLNAAAYQNDSAWMTRHGVNVAMGLKDPIVEYQRTGDKKYLAAFTTGFNDLMTLHGLPYGMFSADEDLHGNDPTQGTELCAIVEAMFSLEQAIGMTGDCHYADALERMAFNALPAQTTDDYNNKQYFQVANQVQISRGVFNFSLPFDHAMNNVLGMRSGYTCCLANMHQGWTKFATHLWYAAPGNGLAAMLYAPCEVTTKAGVSSSEVTIRETTSYPFEDSVRFEVLTKADVNFPLDLRIPAWCKEAVIYLNGTELRRSTGGQLVRLARTWKNNDKLVLHFPMEVRTSVWGRNSRAVERGALVYALKLQERWEKGHQEQEGDYFSVYPESAWNYGLPVAVVQSPAKSVEVKIVKPVNADFNWNLAHAPIEIVTSGKKIPAWQVNEDGVALQPVTDRTGIYKGVVEPNAVPITLVPYGCTKVRIVAFPVVK